MSFPPSLTPELHLPICTTCGTQYSSARDDCPICLDPRQFVPPSGQKWTSLGELLDQGMGSDLEGLEGEFEGVWRVKTTGGSVGIGQTPYVLKTPAGLMIWDTCAFLHPSLIPALRALHPKILGIAISHPHFYCSSLTWARALDTKLYICAADKEWFQRPAEGLVEFWDGTEKELGEGVKMVKCGGHFPGSAVLLWEREDKPGIALCSDTFMIAPNRHTISFMWSVPNLIPLPPADIQKLWNIMRAYDFDAAMSAWPGREIRRGAKTRLLESAREFVRMEGWAEGSVQFEEYTRSPAGWSAKGG